MKRGQTPPLFMGKHIPAKPQVTQGSVTKRGGQLGDQHMPKTARHLWKQVTSMENLFYAFRAAARRKRCNQEVLLFGISLEENLVNIRDRLLTHTWKPGPWHVFTVYEPKERVIHAPVFSDRVVHHALVQVIEPYFERRFIADSYACRVGKGTHAASKRLVSMLRKFPKHKNAYFLKADIYHYFPSIVHDILMDIIKRTVSDVDVLRLIEIIIFENGFNGVGLPIGALTSQLFANIYLDKLDHHMKDCIRLKNYLRYMDDFITIDTDKNKLKQIKNDLSSWLESELRLKLNNKTGVAPVSHGIDFVGYRHWSTHILPRKRTTQKAKRVFRKLSEKYAEGSIGVEDVRPVVASFCGYMKHCNGFRTAGNVFNNLTLRRAS
jgi:retron-type reverse transcriptase